MNELCLVIGKTLRYSVVCDGVLVGFEELEYSPYVLDILYCKVASLDYDKVTVGLYPFMLPAVLEGTYARARYDLSPVLLYECFSTDDIEKITHFLGVCKVGNCKMVSMLDYYKALAREQKTAVVVAINGGYACFVFDGELVYYEECTSAMLTDCVARLRVDHGVRVFVDEYPKGFLFEDVDTTGIDEPEVRAHLAFSQMAGSFPSINDQKVKQEEIVQKEEVSEVVVTTPKKKKVGMMAIATFTVSFAAAVVTGLLCYQRYDSLNTAKRIRESVMTMGESARDNLELIEWVIDEQHTDTYWSLVSYANGSEPIAYSYEDGCYTVIFREGIDETVFEELVVSQFDLEGKLLYTEDGENVIKYTLILRQ